MLRSPSSKSIFSQILIAKDWIWLFRKKSMKKNFLNRRRLAWTFFKISLKRKFHSYLFHNLTDLRLTSKKSQISLQKRKRLVAIIFCSKNFSHCKVEEAWTFKWRKRLSRSVKFNLKRNQGSSRQWPSNDLFLFIFHGPY